MEEMVRPTRTPLYFVTTNFILTIFKIEESLPHVSQAVSAQKLDQIGKALLVSLFEYLRLVNKHLI